MVYRKNFDIVIYQRDNPKSMILYNFKYRIKVKNPKKDTHLRDCISLNILVVWFYNILIWISIMSNIDEKAKNNFTIEMRIFENYEKVKYEIIKVIDFLRHAETNIGMCRIFDNQNHEFWHSVIKPWFQPERFGITHLWFPSGFSHIGYGEYHTIRGNRWLKTPIDRIDRENRIFGYWFPTYKKYTPHRIKVLKLALKDLERIKEEYGKD